MDDERIEVTLDKALFEQVQTLARQRNISFEEAIDAVVRAGLESQAELQVPYQVQTYPLGWRSDIDLTHAVRLAAQLDDEELIRRMQAHKP